MKSKNRLSLCLSLLYSISIVFWELIREGNFKELLVLWTWFYSCSSYIEGFWGFNNHKKASEFLGFRSWLSAVAIHAKNKDGNAKKTSRIVETKREPIIVVKVKACIETVIGIVVNLRPTFLSRPTRLWKLWKRSGCVWVLHRDHCEEEEEEACPCASLLRLSHSPWPAFLACFGVNSSVLSNSLTNLSSSPSSISLLLIFFSPARLRLLIALHGGKTPSSYRFNFPEA